MNKILIIIAVAAVVLTVYGIWKTFEKAGEPGWKALIPVYNFYILLRITGFSGWWATVPVILTISGLNLVTDLNTLVQDMFCPVRDVGCSTGWVTWIFESAVTLFNDGLWLTETELALMNANFLFFNIVAVLLIMLVYESLKNLSSEFNKDNLFAAGLLLLPFIFWPEVSSLDRFDNTKPSQQKESIYNKILKISLLSSTVIILMVIGGQYFYGISDQGDNLMSENEYREIVNSAENQRDPSVCNQVEAYSKTISLGIGGEKQKVVSANQARNLCFRSVRESIEGENQKEGEFLDDSEYKSQESPKSTTSEKYKNNTKRSKTEVQATQNELSSDEYEKLSPLKKAKLAIRANTKFSERGKQFSVHSFRHKYSVYHALEESLVAAEESNSKEDKTLWNLYRISNSGDEELLYSGLIEDCCGGGMPKIKEGSVSFVPVVVAKTGDVCSSKQGNTFVNLRDAPKDYLHIEKSSNCESIGSLQISTSEQQFQFEPILSQKCTSAKPGTNVVFSGLKAKSDDKTYETKFSEPIQMSCIEQSGPTGDLVYSKSISFRGGGAGIRLKEVDFDVKLYDNNKKTSQIIPLTFSLTKGFIDN